MATVEEIAQYIWRRSPQLGVNPALALGIARYEGLNPNTIGSSTFGNPDARGYSFGPFQLYSGSSDPSKIAPGGMAYEFQQKYGQAPSRENWQQQVDFSLQTMANRGTSPWYAVRDRGGPERITELGSQYARTLGIADGAGQQPAAVEALKATTEPQDKATAQSALQSAKDEELFKNLGRMGLSLMAANQPKQTGMLGPVGNRPRRKGDLFSGGLLG